MPDEIDLTQEHIELENTSRIAMQRRQAAAIPLGKPGICTECDTYKIRIVEGLCARCREDQA